MHRDHRQRPSVATVLIPAAIKHGMEAVGYADRNPGLHQPQESRATLADAFHQAGRKAEAHSLFIAAEGFQARVRPGFPLLYSGRGFKFCDLLLSEVDRAAWLQICGGAQGNPTGGIEACWEILKRPWQTIQVAQKNRWLLDIALDNLTIGRALLFSGILTRDESGRANNLDGSHKHVERALDGLRSAGTVDQLPLAYLTRGLLRAVERQPDLARADLDKAWLIAQRGPMRLHMADIHLDRARLFFWEKPYPWTSPQATIIRRRSSGVSGWTRRAVQPNF